MNMFFLHYVKALWINKYLFILFRKFCKINYQKIQSKAAYVLQEDFKLCPNKKETIYQFQRERNNIRNFENIYITFLAIPKKRNLILIING